MSKVVLVCLHDTENTLPVKISMLVCNHYKKFFLPLSILPFKVYTWTDKASAISAISIDEQTGHVD
jgi:hypothetical protein